MQRKQLWKVEATAAIINDYSKIPHIPSDRNYHHLLKNRFEKGMAEQVAAQLTKKYELPHVVIPITLAEMRSGTLCAIDLTVASSLDRDVTVLEADDTIDTAWDSANEADSITLRIQLNGIQGDTRDSYAWFHSDGLTLKDVTLTKTHDGFTVTGTKSDVSFVDSFIAI